MKRLSHGLVALVATLLLAIPVESQAFFGFFGGGFSFGFGGGWHGWDGWGPGYWHRPWYYPYGGYYGYRPWYYRYGPYYGYRPYGLYSYYGLTPYYGLPLVTVPQVTAPETPSAK